MLIPIFSHYKFYKGSIIEYNVILLGFFYIFNIIQNNWNVYRQDTNFTTLFSDSFVYPRSELDFHKS